MMNYIPTTQYNAVTIAPIGVERYLSSNDKIKQSACKIENGNCIVAVLTKPLYTKSERVSLLKEIASIVGQQFSFERVLVTFDGDIFCKIELDQGDMASLQKQILAREGCYEYIRNS